MTLLVNKGINPGEFVAIIIICETDVALLTVNMDYTYLFGNINTNDLLYIDITLDGDNFDDNLVYSSSIIY